MIPNLRPIKFLVVGGGPAGSTAALALAKRGQEVVLVERSGYGALRIGETLPPLAKPLLARLGLDTDAMSLGHLRCPGTVSFWGSDVPFLADSLFDPEGEGLHLDRADFDATLVRQAEVAGATVVTGAEVCACRRDGSHWEVSLKLGSNASSVRAITLIDAAGQKSWPGRPTRRFSFDRQVAMIKFFRLEANSPAFGDRRTWIEATPRGWWYSSALPDDRLVAAFFTDSDLIRAAPQSRDERWVEQLAEARSTRVRLRSSTPLTGARIVIASTTISLPIAAPNYVAVGDAASTIDPLSSHGITYALTTGFEAVESLLAPEPCEAIAQYARAIAARLGDDLDIRRSFCQIERRWPDSPFWQRRWAEPQPVRPLNEGNSTTSTVS